MAEYIISAVSIIVVAIIEALAARERKKTKAERASLMEQERKEKEAAAARERAREEMMILVVESTGAAIALGEATAHALQRGYTNGDTEKALDYAAAIKHKQKDFLTKQGIGAMWE